MKKVFTLHFLLFFFTATTCFSQNSLKILPTDWWSQGTPGSITEATFTVQPQGTYMDVSMYLTITDDYSGFSNDVWLEAVLDFNLPKGSIVYDSWLWMMDDSTIVKADVLDRWTALQDYNEIVDRESDPSILYERDNGYQIRIYPLPGSGSRKVKISYLAPAIWSFDDVSALLPLDILSTSNIPLNHIQLITFPDINWANPKIEGAPDIFFQTVQDATLGEILLAEIPESFFENPIQFQVDAPLNSDGVFVQKLEDGIDKFYQLVYFPPELPQAPNPKKMVFLFDHKESFTNINSTVLLQNIKENCQISLKDEDQFNFIFSAPNGSELLMDSWINASEPNMNTVFSQMTDSIYNYSNLLQSIQDGISFIMDNGGEGELVLFTSSSNLLWNTSQQQDSIFQQLVANEIKIHIVNYSDSWSYQNYNFFQNIMNSNFGNVIGSLDGTSNVWESIPLLFSQLKSQGYNFDLHTSLNNGFTFDRFKQNYLGQSQNLNKPILQIGKYIGGFPMELDYSAISDSIFVFENIIVNPDDVFESDSLTREIWFGHHLQEMENLVVGASEIQEVIDLSIEERVLTKFTAFLALDLEQGAEPCLNCWDFEIVIVATEDLKNDIGVEMSAFPNPFNEECTIDLKLKEGFEIEEASLTIFDAFGKMILTKDLSDLVYAKQTQWKWNGEDASGQRLSSGVYFVIIQTDKGVKTTKLTLMK